MVTSPGLTHVGRLELTYDTPLLFDTHAGTRGFCKVVAGTLNGPRLNGRVADDGGDWLVFRSDGVIDTDSRMMIAAADGTMVYMRNRGCIRATPEAIAAFRDDPDGNLSGHYYRCTPYFDVPPGPLSWLSRTVLLGMGAISRRGSVIDLFEVR